MTINTVKRQIAIADQFSSSEREQLFSELIRGVLATSDEPNLTAGQAFEQALFIAQEFYPQIDQSLLNDVVNLIQRHVNAVELSSQLNGSSERLNNKTITVSVVLRLLQVVLSCSRILNDATSS